MEGLTFIYAPGESADIEYASNQNLYDKIVDIVIGIAKNGEHSSENVWHYENDYVMSVYAGEPGNFKTACKIKMASIDRVPKDYAELYYKDGWMTVFGLECTNRQPKLLFYADNRCYGEYGWLPQIIRYMR